MKDTYDIVCGNKLKILRKKAGMTQTEVGDILNRGKSAISDYESGKLSVSVPMLVKFLKIYKYPLNDFVEECIEEVERVS